MEFSSEIDKLFAALDVFHQTSSFVKATVTNDFLKNKYAPYNTIVSETRADLVKAGLRVKQAITNIEGKTAVYTRLTHLESGQFMAGVAPVAYKDDNPQAQGSGITYQKRYSYAAILDLLIDTDDDGNMAAGLLKAAEETKGIDKLIDKIKNTKTPDELKKLFLNSGTLMVNKKVVKAMNERKAELNENN